MAISKTLADSPDNASKHLLVFSADEPASLQASSAKLLSYASSNPKKLSSLSYTLSQRQRGHYRAWAVTDGRSPAKLSSVVERQSQTARPISFVFTGQGAQWPGMGAELLKAFPTFRDDVKEMDRILQTLPHPPLWTIEEEMSRSAQKSRIQHTEFSHPVCTVLQIGIVRLLKSWNVLPTAVVGHSSGEYAAAHAAGALSLEQAITVAYYCGYITQHRGPAGGMAGVELSPQEVKPYIDQTKGVVVACENSPRHITLSGDGDALDAVLKQIREDKPDCTARRLRVDRAFHSQHMHAFVEEYEQLLHGLIQDKAPSVPFFSSVTAKQIQGKGKLGPSYWRANLESPVLFSRAVQQMLDSTASDSILLEIGPHSALDKPLGSITALLELDTSVSYVPTLVRGTNGSTAMLETLGRLFQESVDIEVVADGDILENLPA